MSEDGAVALLFGVVGLLSAALAWHSILRSHRGRPWFNGDRNLGTAYVRPTALLIYAGR